MYETSESLINKQVAKQHIYFKSHQTKPKSFRIKQLKKLKAAIEQHEKEIETALWNDLHKSAEEAYLTEIHIVKSEIKYHLKNLNLWMKPKKTPTPLSLFPSRSYIHPEPLGVVLLLSPWNYPFQLLLNPLVGAIAAGCCAIIKPSPDAPNTAKIIDKIISKYFDPKYIAVVQGGIQTNTLLLKQKFDLIFFTGSSRVGKIVMKAAAENLTPVILELGGKSPCIVDRDADVNLTAKRIVWGKFLNAGQTCIAPDYLFVHQSIKEDLLKYMIFHIESMYGENPKESKYYARIIHEHAMDRLWDLLEEVKLLYGGKSNKEERYISPTLVEITSTQTKIMQEEIFGPILPILSFSDITEATDYICSKDKPLALYYFGKEKNSNKILQETSSGGGGINNTLLHVANHYLPFGGVGNSGMGRYHGEESFKAFSNLRAIVKTPTWIDIPFAYPPFKYFYWIKKWLG